MKAGGASRAPTSTTRRRCSSSRGRAPDIEAPGAIQHHKAYQNERPGDLLEEGDDILERELNGHDNDKNSRVVAIYRLGTARTCWQGQSIREESGGDCLKGSTHRIEGSAYCVWCARTVPVPLRVWASKRSIEQVHLSNPCTSKHALSRLSRKGTAPCALNRLRVN